MPLPERAQNGLELPLDTKAPSPSPSPWGEQGRASSWPASRLLCLCACGTDGTGSSSRGYFVTVAL